MDFNDCLAAAPHAVQIAFYNHMSNNPDDQGREINVLMHYRDKPVDLLADRPQGDRDLTGHALWSDAEVIEILTDAAKIDQVTGRALGIWEMMRLGQRDMIRRALAKA